MDLFTEPNVDSIAKPYAIRLVDDQAFVAEVLRHFLAEEKDFVVHYCPDPNRAMQEADQIRPTVILQDLVMPGVDGMAIVGRFRANPSTKDTPIIVLSSREDPHTKSLAFSLGANDYLVKLPDRLELVARIRYHSNAYLSQLQRDEAYRALRASQQQLLSSNAALLETNQKLGQALSQVKELRGLLPICSYCKRVRKDDNYWSQIDAYLAEHSDLQLSHGVCDSCYESKTAEGEADASLMVAEFQRRAGLTIAPQSPIK